MKVIPKMNTKRMTTLQLLFAPLLFQREDSESDPETRKAENVERTTGATDTI